MPLSWTSNSEQCFVLSDAAVGMLLLFFFAGGCFFNLFLLKKNLRVKKKQKFK